MKRIIFCTLVLVMFFLNSVYLNAQIQKTLGMDGGFYFNSSNIAYHFSLTYSLQFNQYFGISAGTMFLSVPLDIAGWSDSSRNSSYYFDEDNIKRFNLFFSTFYSRPLFQSTGVYTNWSVSFEPIPYEYISLEKRMNNDILSENVGKYQFTGFSPGTFLEMGLVQYLNRDNNGLRLSLGFGYGWYDMYTGYNRAIIDGQRISTYIPNNNLYKRISLKLIGL